MKGEQHGDGEQERPAEEVTLTLKPEWGGGGGHRKCWPEHPGGAAAKALKAGLSPGSV